MTPNKRFRHLVFDLDDTLLPSSDAYQAAYQALFSVKDRLILQKARKIVHLQLPKGLPARHQRIFYFKRYLEMKEQFSAARNLRLQEDYEHQVLQYLSSWEGLREQRQQLKRLSQKFHLSVLTNECLRTQLLKLRLLDPHGQIFKDRVLTSEEVGAEKPDQRIFEALREKLKIKDFSKAAMIGDSWECDLASALRMKFGGTFWSRQFEKAGGESTGRSPIPGARSVRTIYHLKELNHCLL